MMQFIRGFFSFFIFLFGLAGIAGAVSNIKSCTTYGKVDGVNLTDEKCELPGLKENGIVLETINKGAISETACLIYVRKENWHVIEHPYLDGINCAINGYGYAGMIENKDVVIEESFWKNKTKNEDVCIVSLLLQKNKWIPRIK